MFKIEGLPPLQGEGRGGVLDTMTGKGSPSPSRAGMGWGQLQIFWDQATCGEMPWQTPNLKNTKMVRII